MTLPQKMRARVLDVANASAMHLQHADFERRAVTVFRRPEDARRLALLSRELDRRVDSVRERLRTSKLPVFRDVADEQDAALVALRQLRHERPDRAELRHGSGRTIRVGDEHRLNAVDDHDARLQTFDLGFDLSEIRFGEDVESVLLRADAYRAASNGADRFLTRDVSTSASCATLAHVWRRIVDFPMPGSPERRTTDWMTSPVPLSETPSTRSNSVRPVETRSSSSTVPLLIETARFTPGVVPGMTLIMLFHLPHFLHGETGSS